MNQDRVRRFHQEERAASTISHPNVAHIYEIRESDGNQFIAMEYVEGQTLREKLLTGRLGLKEAIEIALKVAEALIARPLPATSR
jgi:serine/threonine protein kinase